MAKRMGKPMPGDSAPSKVAAMSSQTLPNSKNKPHATKRSKKVKVAPNPAPPPGHCWDFCGSGCKRGSKCRYKHDDAVRKTIHEKKAAMAVPKPHHTYAQAVSKPAAKKKSASDSALVATPKPQKSDITQPRGQYLTPPATPKDAKQTSGHGSKGSELTPPSSPGWGYGQSPSDIQAAVMWNAYRPAKTAEADLWTVRDDAQIDDITTQVFKRIYSASFKLPHLTTKTRRSSNENVQTLAEISDAALKYAQKHVVGSGASQPNEAPENSVTVKAAECYKKALLAGKIENVLNKTEHAHLDILIASQHWNAQLPAANNADTASASEVSKSVANHPEGHDALTKASCRDNEYMAWARANLTDATAIKLARTYCEGLQNGTAPKHLFGRMGKQAPPGTSFQYFSLLPYEVREQIWLLALEEERNDVRIIWQHAEREDGRFTLNRFVNANHQQRLLFVNFELRQLALKHNYELAFGTCRSTPKTYFDFARDRLFLHSRCPSELPKFVRSVRTRDAVRVQNLAIPLRDLVQGNELKIAEALCKFKNVKRIHLVCGDGVEDVRYCGAGDAQLAKKIQRYFSGIWRKHNDPRTCPKIRMYTIPAMIAHDFKIDNMLF